MSVTLVQNAFWKYAGGPLIGLSSGDEVILIKNDKAFSVEHTNNKGVICTRNLDVKDFMNLQMAMINIYAQPMYEEQSDNNVFARVHYRVM